MRSGGLRIKKPLKKRPGYRHKIERRLRRKEARNG